ncbi:hypothetical protein ACJRO7_001192 [Eucalyptus globulus]|uniref:Conserved oligomeric Golgi complex subunit 1 n=1 Tax=Eucalyptus globulus TaxID=34317 RepID=A0ABD3LQ80_EUCGL
MPLFYRVTLSSPPASQLFGGIPNPDEEVRLWKSFRVKLESAMTLETMDSKDVLEGSLDWLKSVFELEIELPWSRIQELVLEADLDLWDEIFEDAFVQRMKSIIDLGFGNSTRDVNIAGSIRTIEETPGEKTDFRAYLSRPSTGGGVWFIEPNDRKTVALPSSIAQAEESSFQPCLDAVDNYCHRVLEDLLHFLESPKAAIWCYEYMSSILMQLKGQVDSFCTALENEKRESHTPSAAIVVERSLFIGRLLFALQNHCRHIPKILGSPRFWVIESISAVFNRLRGLLGHSRGATDSSVSDSPIRQSPMGSRRHTSLATVAVLGADDIPNLCERAHSLWITWLSMELSTILSRDLEQDDGLSSMTPLRGWKDMVIRQEQSDDGQSELRMSLPFVPSLYVISFLFRECEEIHRIGGHVTDIYGNYLSTEEANGSKVSDKGALQVMSDLEFAYNILYDSTMDEELSRSSKPKYLFRQKDQRHKKSAIRTRIDRMMTFSVESNSPHISSKSKKSYQLNDQPFFFLITVSPFTDVLLSLVSPIPHRRS